MKQWQCVPDHKFALRLNRGGDVQCWSEDMVNCAPVCDRNSTTITSYKPATTGAISCGRMLQLLKGVAGYNNSDHWCTTGCDLLGCPKGKNPWRCIPGRAEVVRKTPDGGIACLSAPASQTSGGVVNGQPCMACPVTVDKATGYIPNIGRIVRVPCTDGTKLGCGGGEVLTTEPC